MVKTSAPARLSRVLRSRLLAVTVGVILMTLMQILAPVQSPVSAIPRVNEQLPEPRQRPDVKPPAVAMIPNGSPPGPPAVVPPGAMEEVVPELPAVPLRTNTIVKKTPGEVAEIERKNKVKVVENDDHIYAIDRTDENGNRQRVAVLDTKTKSGTPVLGFAFLDEAEIQAVEKKKKDSKPKPLLGLTPAKASHGESYGAYHDFLNCSYVYQYQNSWDFYIYICPTDVGSVRAAGASAAQAIGIATGHPWLGWWAGVGVWAGVGWMQESDGSIHSYIPESSIRATFGWVYYWGKLQDWFWGHAADAAYDAFGWAQKYLDGSWWRIDYWW